jgi:hypothetical protein
MKLNRHDIVVEELQHLCADIWSDEYRQALTIDFRDAVRVFAPHFAGQ